MRFSIKIWIAAIVFTLGALSVWLAPSSRFFATGNAVSPNQQLIIHAVGPDVRWQPAGSYDWAQLGSGEMSQLDSRLMTGQNSELRLRLPQGQMVLNENTLLNFHYVSPEKTQMTLEKGVLYGRHLSSLQEAFILTGGREFSLKGTGQFRLHVQNTRIFLKFSSGELRVCSLGTCKDNSLGYFELASNGINVKANTFALAGIEDGETHWIGGAVYPLRLPEGAPSDLVLVDRQSGKAISRDAEQSGKIKNQTSVTALNAGNYELRQGSGFLRFQVRTLTNPQVSFIRSEQGRLRLSWSDPSDSEYYTVLIRENDEIGPVVYQQRHTQPYAETGPLQKGMYHMTVASFRADRPDPVLLSSASLYFHDRDGETLQPQISFPRKAYNFELQQDGVQGTRGFDSVPVVAIDWQTNLPAMKYQVQIAKDYSFKHVEYETQSSSNHFVWENSRSGKWFFRVRPWQEWAPAASWSETVQLRVIYGAPLVRIDRLQKNKRAELSWDAHPALKKFEVWNGPNRQIVTERKEIFQLPRGLYVRVRGVDDNGWPLTSWSDLPTIEKVKR